MKLNEKEDVWGNLHPVLPSLSVTTEIGKKVGNLHRFHMCLSMRLLLEVSGVHFDFMVVIETKYGLLLRSGYKEKLHNNFRCKLY